MNDRTIPEAIDPTANEASFTDDGSAGREAVSEWGFLHWTNAGADFRPTAMDGGSAGNAGAVFRPGRRAFLKASAVAGGGLLIGFHLPLANRAGEAQAATNEFIPNAWIRIDANDTVTLRVASSEMGQGVYTAIPMLLAEELECDWARIQVEMAPADKAYTNPLIGMQLTGGSTAVRAFWTPLRQAGAAARDLLIRAAAQTWEVQEDQCRAENGVVLHQTGNLKASYGVLAAKAATLPVPSEVFLKEPGEFKLIGKSTARLDTPLKVNGSAVFGMDVKLPGLLTAVVARCPVFGGKPKKFDATKAKSVPGVSQVLSVHSGIAVVADSFWAAHQGRAALAVEWDEGAHAKLDSAEIRKQLERALKKKGVKARNDGDTVKALKAAPKIIEAVYEAPYLAHACMEPMNCTALVKKGSCELWVPTQNQTGAQFVAAQITGLPSEKIKVNTTFLGGGFGRRSEQDFVAEAVQLAMATGAPVKLIWTREDDMHHDYYRPATLNRLSAALDKDGNPVAWRHEIAGGSIFSRVFPNSIKNGVDNTSVEGAANLPYAIPNLLVTWAMENGAVPVGFWRSVGSSQNAYITECFLDELAAAAGKDPYEYRRALLTKHPRHLGVLELAAQKAGWGTPLQSGRTRGIAVAESFGSYCAQVAEVSVERGQVRVQRVVCAIDCGLVVNPDTVVAQMESGIVYGLTAALKGEITVRNGRIEQGNFNDYPLLRFEEMPDIEVHIVKSAEHPGGAGEPGTPPIAPAVANAVFAATGKPVRKLPIRV
ncbi:MAG TPA: xanthine dehydrogenase family protein molybdopterin-binding subunit [Acidiferrobacterales bacterium]|nr:xanthine dehydrogenase family protein molybdopterin-binding subunit [Acidiferrobacterales bacterium]